MDENSNLLKIQEDIFKFLESIGFLKDLKEACDLFQQRFESKSHRESHFPFCFTLAFNFQQVGELKDLSLVVTNEISIFTRSVEEIIKNFANQFLSDAGSDFVIKLEQVHLNLRIYDLPLQQYKFSLRKIHIQRTLTTFRCIVFSTSPRAQYIRQSVWKCKSCFNAPLTVQRDSRDTHTDPKCFKCRSDCLEIVENRLLSDFCTARVYEADQFKDRSKYFVIKTLKIILFDDLCQELKIGQEYIVTGIFEAPRGHYKAFNITPA